MSNTKKANNDISRADNTSYARSILKIESEAISNLIDKLDDSFSEAVNTILDLPENARVILSGMGKTSFIAMKISATLASTGISSFFLHPAEAVHGDLGRFKENDIAILISNSGETEEILRIIPQIKRTGCKIISITSAKDSALAKYSNTNLAIGSHKEAGPLGLAPTTSTTVMLALGDALAMTVLRHQDFSREQFAKYHPAGSLGQGLIPVTDIMRTGKENCIVNQTSSAREVLRSIAETKGRPGAATIIDDKGVLVGVFTDGNLRRCLDNDESFLDKPISEVMGKEPKKLTDSALSADALHIISNYKIDQVIIVNDSGEPIGLIDVQDLLPLKSYL